MVVRGEVEEPVVAGVAVDATESARRFDDKNAATESGSSSSCLLDEFDEPVYDGEVVSDDDGDDDDADEQREEQKPPRTRKEKLLRKASVAAAGGGLVAAGVAMMVLPGPGIPTVAAGLHVLGKEFKTAKKAEDKLVDSTKKVGEEIKKRTSPETRKRASDAKKKVLETTDSVRSEIMKSSRSFGKGVKKRTPPKVRKSVGGAKKQLLQKIDGIVGTKEQATTAPAATATSE